MIIETDETINLSLMINNINEEAQLMLNAMIESNQICIIKKTVIHSNLSVKQHDYRNSY